MCPDISPELYDPYREELEVLKTLMRRLQTKLEGPPGCMLAPRPEANGP